MQTERKPYGYIYLITNRVNGRYYVGQTVKTIEYRWLRHRYAANAGSKQYIHRAIRKYGSTAFDISELTSASTQSELDTLEKLWIIALSSDSQHLGYNMASGGEGGSPFKGRKHSEATKAKIRKAATGVECSEDTRLKIRAGNLRKKDSPETRLRKSKAHKGLRPTPVAIRTLSNTKRSIYPCGVTASNGGAQFIARITKGGKRVFLGSFPTVELASQAYQEAFETL